MRRLYKMVGVMAAVLAICAVPVMGAEVQRRNVDRNGLLYLYNPERVFEAPLYFANMEIIAGCRLVSGNSGTNVEVEAIINVSDTTTGVNYNVHTNDKGVDIISINRRAGANEIYKQARVNYYFNGVQHKDYWEVKPDVIIHNPDIV